MVRPLYYFHFSHREAVLVLVLEGGAAFEVQMKSPHSHSAAQQCFTQWSPLVMVMMTIVHSYCVFVFLNSCICICIFFCFTVFHNCDGSDFICKIRLLITDYVDLCKIWQILRIFNAFKVVIFFWRIFVDANQYLKSLAHWYKSLLTISY